MSNGLQRLGSTRGRSIILALLLAAVIVQFVRSNVGGFFVVEGLSMYPTFKPNDVVKARSLGAQIQRGDIVINTDDRGEQVIKRVVGLPGETVTIFRGFVYVNGQRLSEPYLMNYTYTFNGNPHDERPSTRHLRSDQYFVLGDNRMESCDSRHYGPINRSQIVGRVSLPDNSARPEFCNVMLSEDGKVLPAKTGQPDESRTRLRNELGKISAAVSATR